MVERLGGMSLVERLEVAMSKTEDNGMYTTTNTIFAALEEIQRYRSLILDIGKEIQNNRLIDEKAVALLQTEYKNIVNGTGIA